MAHSMEEISHLPVEYHELNNHIRECWKYISDLLRNFLFIQILLISLMFLGGGVIEVDGVDVQISPERSKSHTGEENKTNASPAAGIKERNKEFVIFPLIFIGLAGSIGAMAQNVRLFRNATAFVRRAAYLEIEGNFLKDGRAPTLGGTTPPNVYMSEKLYVGEKGFDHLKLLMTLTYIVFFLLWLYYTARVGFDL